MQYDRVNAFFLAALFAACMSAGIGLLTSVAWLLISYAPLFHIFLWIELKFVCK